MGRTTGNPYGVKKKSKEEIDEIYKSMYADEKNVEESDFHYHQVKPGFAVRCYHKCKNTLTSWQFWFGITIANWIEFLPEHLFWFRVWPFYLLARWMKLQ